MIFPSIQPQFGELNPSNTLGRQTWIRPGPRELLVALVSAEVKSAHGRRQWGQAPEGKVANWLSAHPLVWIEHGFVNMGLAEIASM